MFRPITKPSSGGLKEEILQYFACHSYPFSVSRNVKVKVMFTLEQATKAQRGSTGIALLLL
jgi:hypothetical protein